ncbi:MAG: CDP-diacylglycerol--glycerol-3-phosphate 3-phosphatidyltransferase [Bacilli bacterium]|nr:CDP-diacylglycerol--glycerol-3-phosphate 3-phosphatidyltransferase [Bacilli bacterium]
MNLPNKITMCRIVMAVLVLIILMFPYSSVGITLPIYEPFNNITIRLDYIIAGFLFVIASFTDFLDGNIARKNNLVTDFGKVMDAIADKVLVNGVLILLAFNKSIPAVIPVIIITRDTVVDAIKMVAGKKNSAVGASIWGKIKTICMMVGLSLTFFSNIPFEIVGIRLDSILLYAATILSVYSGIEYFIVNKKYFLEDK